MPAMVNSPPGDHPDKGAENAESQAESKADLAAAPVSGQGSTGGDSQAKPRNVGPVPAFLDRTYAMVDEEDSAEIVGWGVSGDTFVIKRLDLFEEEVIPRFFNHRNLYSFVRQLNNHGELGQFPWKALFVVIHNLSVDSECRIASSGLSAERCQECWPFECFALPRVSTRPSGVSGLHSV